MKLIMIILTFVTLVLSSSSLSVKEQVKKIKTLPEIIQKKIAVVLGSIVSDAASVPLLWIYDEKVGFRYLKVLNDLYLIFKVLLDIVGDEKRVEFWPESNNPYNTLPEGAAFYLDYILTTIDTVTRDNGKISIKHLTEAVLETFGGEDTKYQTSLRLRENNASKPIPGPWITSCMVKSMKKMEEGKRPSGSEECIENDGFVLGTSIKYCNTTYKYFKKISLCFEMLKKIFDWLNFSITCISVGHGF